MSSSKAVSGPVLCLDRCVNIWKSHFCFCGAFSWDYTIHLIRTSTFFLSVLLELSLIFSCWEMDYRAENTRLQVSRLETSSALIVVEKDLPLKEPSLACPSFSRRLVKSCL